MTEQIEVLYFGFVAHHGHDLRSKIRSANIYKDTPWGVALDGGLLDGERDIPNGTWFERHKDGWSAVSFWDRSGDERPNSNSAFIVHAEMDGKSILDLARAQWPEVFARPGFPIRS